jgi:hypothetical protein
MKKIIKKQETAETPAIDIQKRMAELKADQPQLPVGQLRILAIRKIAQEKAEQK